MALPARYHYLSINALQLLTLATIASVLLFIDNRYAAMVVMAGSGLIWALFNQSTIPNHIKLNKLKHSILLQSKLVVILLGYYFILIKNQQNIALYTAIVCQNLLLLVPTQKSISRINNVAFWVATGVIAGNYFGWSS